MPNTLSSEDAQKQIIAGRSLENVVVDGAIDVSENVKVRKLPEGLKCYELNASGTSISELPAKTKVECEINLSSCRQLESLPAGLTTGTLNLRNCSSLAKLPERLNVWFLDVGGCRLLNSFPKKATIENGHLSVAGCEELKELPGYLTQLSTLDVSDCPNITSLPSELKIGLWIDIGGSGITELPAHLKDVGLRWRGVAIDEQIAFRPESLDVKQALGEINTERRRVMIERMGYERFFEEAKVKRLDRDTDTGGKRELVRVPLENDEDIVCLSCSCPSTSRHYFLRVPPEMKTCHQAAAWMAGFEDPKKYKPVIET